MRRRMKRRSPGFHLLLVSLAALVAATTVWSAQGPSTPAYVLSLAGTGWAVELDLSAHRILEEWTREDGSGAMVFAEPDDGNVLVSAYLEREPQDVDSDRCREKYFSRAVGSPLPKEKVKRWEDGRFGLGEYTITESSGVRLDQRHVHAYFGKGNACLDLHLSKTRYGRKDTQLFERFLAKAAIVAEPAPESAAAQERTWPLEGRLRLRMRVPKGWTQSLETRGSPPVATITFEPPAGPAWVFLVSSIPGGDQPERFSDDQWMRNLVNGSARTVLPESVERKVDLHRTKGLHASGYYFEVTDKKKKLEEGDYRYMTEGFVGLDQIGLTFTILANEKNAPVVREALAAIRSARLVEEAPAGGDTEN